LLSRLTELDQHSLIDTFDRHDRLTRLIGMDWLDRPASARPESYPAPENRAQSG